MLENTLDKLSFKYEREREQVYYYNIETSQHLQ